MGSKGRIPPAHMRRPLSGPDPFGPGMRPPHGAYPPFDMLPPPQVMEQKLAAQHVEMQRLVVENQRLAATHGSLRQELAGAQHELQILHAQIGAIKSEREQQMSSLVDSIAKMEADLKSAEPVKAELQKARADAQSLVVSRQELITNVQQLGQDLQRTHADVQQIPALVAQLDGLRQEYQLCRDTYDYEKRLYSSHLESLQVMEKNYVTMAREVEKLRAELLNNSNVDRRTGAPYYGTPGNNENEATGQAIGQNAFEDSYGVQQIIILSIQLKLKILWEQPLHKMGVRLADIHLSQTLRKAGALCTGYDVNNLSYDQLQNRVCDILTRKRFILVLDDLWNYSNITLQPLLDVLSLGEEGSKVLVTSRISEVSNIMGSQSPYYLQCLDDDESWSLFEGIAFKQDGIEADVREELVEYGKEIVRKCKGLPLAVKQMGGLLRGKTVDEWKVIVRSQAWEVQDDEVMPALRLSYKDLPSPAHKQCFAYCSLFPKDHVYEKNELVKLWMAESFIQPDNRQRTEDIGRACFKDLADRFFFESLSQGTDNGKYKMHDLIHDLAQKISWPFCFQLTDMRDLEPSFDDKSRHVSMLSKDVEQLTREVISRSNKLRTLLFPVQHMRAFGKAQHDIFKSLMHVRVLDLSSSTLLKLPDSIEELKLLHYLDLSKTEIKRLPDSICKLYNLETLKLLGCPWLSSLPRKLKNLVKLRHLELDEMFWHKMLTFPQSMGCLTSLHNLHKFRVGHDTGYKLEELNRMEYLTGTLHISKLENAVNAVDANLRAKERIQKVVYEWSSNRSGLNLQEEDTEKQVLEDLQPQSRVEELQICHYRGTDFPVWMKYGQLRSLVSIFLNGCTRIKVLTLGELHNLKELRLKNLLELEEWQGERDESLLMLKMSNCPKLTKMPCFFTELRSLKIKK